MKSQSMNTQKQRRDTFLRRGRFRWPYTRDKSYLAQPSTLASAGFYFNPVKDAPDNVQCFMCGFELTGWESKDDPFMEHITHEPKCIWARHHCNTKRSELGDRVLWSGWNSETMELSEINEIIDAVDERARTFVGWPHSGSSWKVTPQRLAEAGFYYTPEWPGDDTATCAFCGYGLAEWEADDVPFEEHLRRAPDCPFFVVPKEVDKLRKAGEKRSVRLSSIGGSPHSPDTPKPLPPRISLSPGKAKPIGKDETPNRGSILKSTGSISSEEEEEEGENIKKEDESEEYIKDEDGDEESDSDDSHGKASVLSNSDSEHDKYKNDDSDNDSDGDYEQDKEEEEEDEAELKQEYDDKPSKEEFDGDNELADPASQPQTLVRAATQPSQSSIPEDTQVESNEDQYETDDALPWQEQQYRFEGQTVRDAGYNAQDTQDTLYDGSHGDTHNRLQNGVADMTLGRKSRDAVLAPARDADDKSRRSWGLTERESQMTVEEFIRACCAQKIAALDDSVTAMIGAFVQKAHATRERIGNMDW